MIIQIILRVYKKQHQVPSVKSGIPPFCLISSSSASSLRSESLCGILEPDQSFSITV